MVSQMIIQELLIVAMYIFSKDLSETFIFFPFQSMFFFLTQTEQGDIFKITLETDEDMVTEIRLKYFDTVPVASSMCVLKTGFLFVASEFSNQ